MHLPPPPPSRELLAAFTIQSISSFVMSPSQSEIRSLNSEFGSNEVVDVASSKEPLLAVAQQIKIQLSS